MCKNEGLSRHQAVKIKIFKSCSYEQCSCKWSLRLVEEKRHQYH